MGEEEVCSLDGRGAARLVEETCLTTERASTEETATDLGFFFFDLILFFLV